MTTEETASRRSRVLLLLRSEVIVGFSLAVVVGLVAGLGAVAFRWMIRGFQWLFFKQGAAALSFMGDYYVIILPAIGGLFVGLIIHYLAREAKGHGVPEVMAAVAARGGRIRRRVSVVASVASAICIGSGGSAGREGPIVLIGSSFGSTVGQWLKLPEDWLRTLVACGAAGGISATFNAPIAGVFFALEVILGRFITPRFGYVVLSSVVATLTAHAFLGDERMFLIPEYRMVSSWEILFYVLLGIAAGLVALCFVYLLYRSEDLFETLKFPEYFKPLLGGIIIGIMGLYYADLFGVGYGAGYGVGGEWVTAGGVDKALGGAIAPATLLGLAALKIVATSTTLGSGGSGGIFAPSLFIGSSFGGAFAWLVQRAIPAASTGAYALVGMAAVFAGAARAPLTAIVILWEITGDYAIILPLMVAVVISTIVARSLNPESIYTTKVRRLGVDLRRAREADVMKTITVREAMTPNFPTVPPEMSMRELVERMRNTGHHGFPVVDGEGRLCGVVTVADVEAAVTKDEAADLRVADIATQEPITAYPDQSLHDALSQFGGQEVGRIPVVDRKNPTRLLGVLRRHDIIRAYAKRII